MSPETQLQIAGVSDLTITQLVVEPARVWRSREKTSATQTAPVSRWPAWTDPSNPARQVRSH